MTEIHVYRCDICCKSYETEEECRQCEWEHAVENMGGQLFLYDKDGEPITLKTVADLENAFYIHWLSATAIDFAIEWMEEYFGYAGNLSDYGGLDEGRIYYVDDYRTRNPRWEDFEELEAETQRIKGIFKQGEK